MRRARSSRSTAGCTSTESLRLDHLLVRRAFLVLLGLVHLAAFLSLWSQVQGLLGSEGLLPAEELLEQAAARLGSEAVARVPSLLWLARRLGSVDAGLHALCATGVAASLLLVVGAAPRAALAALWVLYLSLVSVGDVFLGYQWDALLLETTLLALFLAPGALRPRRASRAPVSVPALWLLRFLLFKLMFLSGAVKLLSGDPTWRGLTALRFHYLTQPLPSWTSFYADHLPGAVNSLSTAVALGIELLLPLLIFLPRWPLAGEGSAGPDGARSLLASPRLLAFVGLAGLQGAILATGNYGFFNWLTLALCLLLLDDAALLRRLPRPLRARAERFREDARRAAPESTAPVAGRAAPEPTASSAGRVARARHGVFLALLALAFALSALPLSDRLGLVPLPVPVRAVQQRLAPFRSLNGYGLFAVMTTERLEIGIEGSRDGRTWRPYRFRWKPGPVDRRPRFTGPHMPRVDWQMWFAALRGCERSPWFHWLLLRILQGEPSVLALLDENPFPERPPRYLRTPLRRYTFAPLGAPVWWDREDAGAFCPAVALDGERLVAVPGMY